MIKIFWFLLLPISLELQEATLVRMRCMHFHKSLNNKLNESSCHIDGFYYCPFHPDGVIKIYKKNLP